MTSGARVAIPIPTSRDLEYNRRSWPMYAAAVLAVGAVPVEVALGLTDQALMTLARGCDGVLLPGSPSDVDPELYGQAAVPECAPADGLRERTDRLLLEEASAAGKPVLGICYGLQSINVWRGGTLVQDLAGVPVNHAAGAAVSVAHTVILQAQSRLAEIVGSDELRAMEGDLRLPVNSSHHQSIEQVGAGLRVSAVASEDGVVEAVEGREGSDLPAFLVAVQWHPERSFESSAASRLLFEAFAEAMEAQMRVARESAGRSSG